MNRTQYRTARRMIRDNGRYALRWLDAKDRTAMERLLFNVQDTGTGWPSVPTSWAIAAARASTAPRATPAH